MACNVINRFRIACIFLLIVPATNYVINKATAVTYEDTSLFNDFRIIFDWRDKGVITFPSNQGQMGNAMDICKREAVESMYAINHHKLIGLSTNQVVDCCDNMTPNFDCIQKLGGLCSSTDYGDIKGFCPPVNCTQYGKLAGTRTIPHGDEDGMKQAIHVSPLLAYINAGLMSFQVYSSGVYTDPDCTEQDVDHVVQIVGYGVQGDDNGFWIIRNSWGPDWGQKGYMFLQRGHNMCGIASHAFFPYQ